MPLLDLEPNLFPANLLEHDRSRTAEWWVMYTLARQEKTLMRHLHARQIGFYSPIVEHRYRSGAGRMRVSYLPLFSNYVFVHGTDQDRSQAVATGCVSRHLPVHDGATFADQLRSIQQLIESRLPVTLEAKLEAGQPVRIKSGPLTGVQGVILQRRENRRLLIQVDFLQQGASIALDDWEVERL